MQYLLLKKHSGHGTGAEMRLHASTFPILQALLSQISGAPQPIDVILDAKLRKEVKDNRAKLSSIVDNVILCGCGGTVLLRNNLTQNAFGTRP